MFSKQRIIIYIVIAVVLVGVGFAVVDRFTGWTDQKRRAQFAADRAVDEKIIETLRRERDAAIAEGDKKAADAIEGQKQIAGLEVELARFGAAGAKAVERQEEAAKQFNAEVNTIRNASDPCVLCRDLCAERQRQSTADFDVSCAADYCDRLCRPVAAPGP